MGIEVPEDASRHRRYNLIHARVREHMHARPITRYHNHLFQELLVYDGIAKNLFREIKLVGKLHRESHQDHIHHHVFREVSDYIAHQLSNVGRKDRGFFLAVDGNYQWYHAPP